MGVLSTMRNFVTAKLRRRHLHSDTPDSKNYPALEFSRENPRRSDTMKLGVSDVHSRGGWISTGSFGDNLASVISSNREDMFKKFGESGDGGSRSSSSDLETLEALWPEMAFDEGLPASRATPEPSMIVSSCNFNVAHPTPLHSTLCCPVMRDVHLPAYLPHPSDTFSKCLAILLRDVRNGHCTRQNFDTLLKLIRMEELEDLSALQMLVGSALMHLLISRMTDETFKTSGPYEEAFEAVVQLLDNADVLEWCMQQDFLEIVDWMLRAGTTNSKKHALTFLSKISAANAASDVREKFEGTVIRHFQSIMAGIVEVILTRSLLHLLNPALATILSLCSSPNIHDVAAKVGLVEALIEILPLQNPEREDFVDKIAENCLSILKIMSTTPAGLQSLRGHGGMVPLMIDVMLEFTDSATKDAVDIFRNLCTTTRAPNLVIVAKEESELSWEE